MSEFNERWRGGSCTVTLFPAVEAKIAEKIRRVARNSTGILVDRMKQIVPVRTGALRDSLTTQEAPNGKSFYVMGLDYGLYQEFGTYKMAAQPFIRPALAEWREMIKQAIAMSRESI